jgi:hypothetical protein
MSAVVESRAAETAAYGGMVDAIGGIAAAVLAIIGLTGFDPEGMAAIAVIVLGAAFLVQAGAILSEYSHILSADGATALSGNSTAGEGLAAMLMAGAGGIVLGVLALLNIATVALTAIAVIAFGAALVLSSSSVRALYAGQRARSGPELIMTQMASGSAGVQLLTGLAAVVLGILAVAGRDPRVLSLAALLVLGITVLLTGSALSTLVVSFVRRPSSSQSMTR